MKNIKNDILSKLISEKYRDAFIGDFDEVYFEIKNEYGSGRAILWYLIQILTTMPYLVQNMFTRSMDMLANYIKIAVRNLRKNKVYSTINLLGLAIGLTGCILIYLYVMDELTYDRFHTKETRIYRLINTWMANDGSIESVSASLPAAMGKAFEEYFPEVENFSRISYSNGIVTFGDDVFRERITIVDKDFFNIFSFDLKTSDHRSVLQSDNSIVLTEEYSRKFFGDEDPVGKSLYITFGEVKKEYTVSDVSENVPSNSTISFNMLINIDNMPITYSEDVFTNMGDFSIPYFILINEDFTGKNIEDKLPQFTEKTFAKMFDNWRSRGLYKGERAPIQMKLQRMQDIHLNPEVYGGTDIKYSIILGSIALIILTIACINFMNLSIGRGTMRSVEIGIRKVIGAGRKQLLRQFWIESIVLTFTAMLLGLALSYLVLPVFNELSDKNLNFANLINIENILFLMSLSLLVGVLSGSYPGIVMAAFKPVEILKGRLKIGGKNLIELTQELSIFCWQD